MSVMRTCGSAPTTARSSAAGPVVAPAAGRAMLAMALCCCWPLALCGQAQKEGAAMNVNRVDFFVSTQGNDTWSGALADPNPVRTDGPFATLSRARDAVRDLLKDAQERHISVVVRGGVYGLTETVVFSGQDSARGEQSISYSAYPGETPVFSGAAMLKGWRALDVVPEQVPESVRGRIWVADVSHIRRLKSAQAPAASVTDLRSEDWRFFTLYDGDRRLPRARGPGFAPTSTMPRGTRDRQTLHFPEGALENWPDLPGAELLIIPSYFWVMNILPIESVDESARVAKTAVPGTYPLGRNGMSGRPTAWVENVLAVLDQPDEWVLDGDRAVLYLCCETDPNERDILVPVLTELLRVSGEIDYEGGADTPVRNIAFRGLTFTHGERLSWHGGTGWGLQHDWERFDSPTALLRLRAAEGCVVEQCHFVGSGHTAIRLDLHCRGNRIAGNHIEHIGGVGILLAGYGPGTKDVNRDNEIVSNYIHHIGELYWGSVGIFAWQSGGNRIAHNLIHSCPYTGIVVSGRIGWDPDGRAECSRTVRWDEVGVPKTAPIKRLSWQEREPFLHGRRNMVEYNDIHNVMEVCGDGNCIYISGTGGGNRVRHNYCHDCTGLYMNAVIRCDDDQHGTLMEGNICTRTGGHGEGFISKGDNDIINNIVADMRPGAQHRGYVVFPYGSVKGATIQRNILYSMTKGQTLYGESQGGGRRGPPPRLRDTDADANLYYCTAAVEWGIDHLERERAFGIEQHSAVADPLFVAPARDDFSLKPGSVALRLGIEPLDVVGKAGLLPADRERLLGRPIAAYISPGGGVLWEPVEVVMGTAAPGAEIRYTLDGSEPTRHAALYAAPFVLDAPATVRARAFADGGTDVMGAVSTFALPPQPLVEDFESVEVGAKTPGATTSEENDTMTARVTDERAASGTHSLKFSDGPGQKYPFNPHVYYRVSFASVRVTGSLDLLVDAGTRFYYQWRQYGPAPFLRGPTVQIEPGGRLVHNGDELMSIPVGQWVRLVVDCQLGSSVTGDFALRVLLPGKEEPVAFEALKYEEGFERLDWLGLVPNGQARTEIYVDNIALQPSRE